MSYATSQWCTTLGFRLSVVGVCIGIVCRKWCVGLWQVPISNRNVNMAERQVSTLKGKHLLIVFVFWTLNLVYREMQYGLESNWPIGINGSVTATPTFQIFQIHVSMFVSSNKVSEVNSIRNYWWSFLWD